MPCRARCPLHRLEAAAAEGDVIDDAGIRALRLVGGRNVVEMEHRMAVAVEPRPRKVEGRSRPIHETEHVPIEADGVVEVAGRDVIMIEHTDAHAHEASPPGPVLGPCLRREATV